MFLELSGGLSTAVAATKAAVGAAPEVDLAAAGFGGMETWPGLLPVLSVCLLLRPVVVGRYLTTVLFSCRCLCHLRSLACLMVFVPMLVSGAGGFNILGRRAGGLKPSIRGARHASNG
ncbi:hypothetical protein E2320_001450 [Naja naja]|nr:hypothetical protein E2320_001450 [Naja naja]